MGDDLQIRWQKEVAVMRVYAELKDTAQRDGKV
jgi:hypothetical protein